MHLMKMEFYPLLLLEVLMSKIDLNNISHTYNPNDPEPTYALNPFSMTWENGKDTQYWDLQDVEKLQC